VTFAVRTVERAGHVLVEVAGEVDMRSRSRLAEALDRAVGGGAVTVVVDLSEVSFFSAAGVSCLDDAADVLAAGRGRLRLVCPQSGAVWRVLTLLELESAWPVHPTAADAVEAITRATV